MDNLWDLTSFAGSVFLLVFAEWTIFQTCFARQKSPKNIENLLYFCSFQRFFLALQAEDFSIIFGFVFQKTKKLETFRPSSKSWVGNFTPWGVKKITGLFTIILRLITVLAFYGYFTIIFAGRFCDFFLPQFPIKTTLPWLCLRSYRAPVAY